MSNFSSEVNSEEPDPNRTVNIPKKKSGFQITSVTDSGHGRPLSIVRDGEESADDLDESHASYSDVSYSRATDADHDQESTASEDTLNISVHESTNVTHADGVINHVGAIHHTHTHHEAGFASKAKLQKDTTLELKKSHHILPLSIPKNNLNKENSEHLDSPQELPHDNTSGETVREKKSEDPSKRVDSSPGTSVKVATPQSASSQQSPLNTTSTVLSSNISSIVTTQSSTSNASTDFAETAPSETIPMAAASSVVATMAATKSTVIPGVKVPGTRVYKVVKRDSAQPTKRVRGRWNWYDFSDTQAPMTGITQSGEEIRMASSGPVHTFTYTNPLMSPTVMPYTLQQSGSASTLKDHLLSAGLSSTSDIGELKASASHRQVIGLAADALKTAIKGDAATGDTNDSGRTLKIDNKIEAAMDLVKKHLMSAVRDEVDELKEKIKDLTEETTRLKNENEELRAALPTEVVSHVDGSLSPPKDSSSTEDHQNDDNSSSLNKVSNEGALLNHASQKGMNVSIPQDGSKPPLVSMPQDGSKPLLVSMPQDGSKPLLSSARLTDPKTKLGGSNAPQSSIHQSQRQDVQMTATTKTTTTSLVGGQPVVTAQVHMQMSLTPGQNTQQNVDPQIMHEQGTQDIVKTNAKRNDPNFDKKNPP